MKRRCENVADDQATGPNIQRAVMGKDLHFFSFGVVHAAGFGEAHREGYEGRKRGLFDGYGF